MKKYCVLSILNEVRDTEHDTFARMYSKVGQNTGNLLFANAAWRQVSGQKKRVGFTFDPDYVNRNFDALIIPAANWLGTHVDFGQVADLIEKITVPVTLIGLGAQDATYSGAVQVPEGSQRFVRAVSERSKSISVRGRYTQDVLAKIGVTNVVVTGCPSLYMDFRSFVAPRRPRVRFERGLFHSTRFSASYVPFAEAPSIHRSLYRFAYEHQLDLLIQSEPEELAEIVQTQDGPVSSEFLQQQLVSIYDAPSWPDLRTYLRSRSHTFLNVDDWSRALDRYDYAFGTRLHGTIMALNSGVPAVLVHHDSRTKEMSEFAKIPSISAKSFAPSAARIKRCIETANYADYYRQRVRNKDVYVSFLRDNGIEYDARWANDIGLTVHSTE